MTGARQQGSARRARRCPRACKCAPPHNCRPACLSGQQAWRRALCAGLGWTRRGQRRPRCCSGHHEAAARRGRGDTSPQSRAAADAAPLPQLPSPVLPRPRPRWSSGPMSTGWPRRRPPRTDPERPRTTEQTRAGVRRPSTTRSSESAGSPPPVDRAGGAPRWRCTPDTGCRLVATLRRPTARSPLADRCQAGRPLQTGPRAPPRLKRACWRCPAWCRHCRRKSRPDAGRRSLGRKVGRRDRPRQRRTTGPRCYSRTARWLRGLRRHRRPRGCRDADRPRPGSDSRSRCPPRRAPSPPRQGARTARCRRRGCPGPPRGPDSAVLACRRTTC